MSHKHKKHKKVKLTKKTISMIATAVAMMLQPAQGGFEEEQEDLARRARARASAKASAEGHAAGVGLQGDSAGRHLGALLGQMALEEPKPIPVPSPKNEDPTPSAKTEVPQPTYTPTYSSGAGSSFNPAPVQAQEYQYDSVYNLIKKSEPGKLIERLDEALETWKGLDEGWWDDEYKDMAPEEKLQFARQAKLLRNIYLQHNPFNSTSYKSINHSPSVEGIKNLRRQLQNDKYEHDNDEYQKIPLLALIDRYAYKKDITKDIFETAAQKLKDVGVDGKFSEPMNKYGDIYSKTSMANINAYVNGLIDGVKSNGNVMFTSDNPSSLQSGFSLNKLNDIKAYFATLFPA